MAHTFTLAEQDSQIPSWTAAVGVGNNEDILYIVRLEEREHMVDCGGGTRGE